MVVAALSTTLLGCPGFELLWTVTLIKISLNPEIVVHRRPLEVPILAQKLLTIL